MAASSQKQLIYYSIFQDLLTLFEGHKMQDSKLSLPVSFVKAEKVTVFKSHNKSNTVSNNEAVTEEGIFTSTKNWMIPASPIVPLKAVPEARQLWLSLSFLTATKALKIRKIVPKRPTDYPKKPLVVKPSLVPARCGNDGSRAFFSIITLKAGGGGWFCFVAFWSKFWLLVSSRAWRSSFFHSPAGGIKWQIMDISVRNNSRTSL